MDITPKVKRMIEKAIVIMGSQRQLGFKLLYNSTQPGAAIRRVLNDEQWSIPRFRFARLLKVLAKGQ